MKQRNLHWIRWIIMADIKALPKLLFLFQLMALINSPLLLCLAKVPQVAILI